MRNHGPAIAESFQIVDDGGFSEPELGLRPWMSVKLWEVGLEDPLVRNPSTETTRRLKGSTPPMRSLGEY